MYYSPWRSLLKLFFVLGVVGALIFLGLLLGRQFLVPLLYPRAATIVFAVPFKKTTFQDLGVVFDPELEIPIKTRDGQVERTFLLDSGAVVSSLPREMAESLGYNLAFMPRSAFRGFGGTTSFAYRGEMTVILGEEETSLPTVFTEAQGTRYILGRKGFFDRYSIFFDHQNSRIEIRK